MNISIKEHIRTLLKLTPSYLKAKKNIDSTDKKNLLKFLRSAVKNVPYYNSIISKPYNDISIENFPIIRKSMIMGNESSFVSKHFCKTFLSSKETGGSTGKSLTLYYSKDALIKKNVYSDYAFSMIGKNLNIAMLRGIKPEGGKLFEKIKSDYHILSAYQLTSDTLDEYLQYIRNNHINCLHVYPSAISIMARLIKNKYGEANIPELKGILSSSEIFSAKEKQLVKEVFGNITIVDFYSQNELSCCALSVDNGFYHFFESFGHVEFMETGEKINGNRICEIISTGFLNKAMPLIRYATDDYVELDENNNVVSIIGRTSDFVYNINNELAPCIINTRDISMSNVTNFQYYQPKIGSLIFRIMVTPNFTEQDRRHLLEDMDNSFNGKMNCDVVVVDTIEKTKRGKQLRLISEVNNNQ